MVRRQTKVTVGARSAGKNSLNLRRNAVALVDQEGFGRARWFVDGPTPRWAWTDFVAGSFSAEIVADFGRAEIPAAR